MLNLVMLVDNQNCYTIYGPPKVVFYLCTGKESGLFAKMRMKIENEYKLLYWISATKLKSSYLAVVGLE